MRDAAARLPGGAGTRADFILLLRDSQYLVEEAPDREVVLSVSGALDRLQHETSNNGPCIEYDPARRVGPSLSLPPPPPRGIQNLISVRSPQLIACMA